MYLIQLLLPRTKSGKAPLQDDAIAQTRAELVAVFEGITAYLRSPAQGAWTAPDGDVEVDEVVMVEVLTEELDRAWWKAYTAKLAARFDQEVIHVRAVTVETL